MSYNEQVAELLTKEHVCILSKELSWFVAERDLTDYKSLVNIYATIWSSLHHDINQMELITDF